MTVLFLTPTELGRLSSFSEHARELLAANIGLSTVIEDISIEQGPFIAIRTPEHKTSFSVYRLDARMAGVQVANSLSLPDV